MKMSRLLPLALALALSPAPTFAAPAADKVPTAFETLAIARKQLGDAVGSNLLSMRSDHSKLRPRFWWIRFFDQSVFLKVRAVYMIGPEMIRNIEPGNIFDGGDSRYVIRADELKYDSDKCVLFLEKCAKDSGIPLHSLDMSLEKPHEGETSPVWTFDWYDSNRGHLGMMKVSATTGKVVEIVDLKIKSPRFGSVARRSAAGSVEDTFLDIGADMEEFFTGKRTVDTGTDDPVKPAKDAKEPAAKD